MVGIYPSIPHQAGLEALREALNKRKTHKVPTNKLIKMAEFVLKNNYFQFSDKVYQQISGTAIGSLLLLMRAYLWIKWKLSSYKLKSFNLECGLGTLMIFSLSGLIAKKVSKIL